MNESILTIIIVVLVSLGVFGLIKLICKPIKTKTAILLVIPTVATCGIALFIFKAFRGNHVMSNNSLNNYSNVSYDDIPTFDELEKEKKKKPSRAFTDVSGKTSYYDDEGNFMGVSTDNGHGKMTFTDAEGNYIGEGFNNGLGKTIYTDKDGNITSSNTNYRGDEAFSDGTTARDDSSGNTYY